MNENKLGIVLHSEEKLEWRERNFRGKIREIHLVCNFAKRNPKRYGIWVFQNRRLVIDFSRRQTEQLFAN